MQLALYEKGRTTAMGHWIDVPFNAANFAGYRLTDWTVVAGESHRESLYSLIGKTLHWNLVLNDGHA